MATMSDLPVTAQLPTIQPTTPQATPPIPGNGARHRVESKGPGGNRPVPESGTLPKAGRFGAETAFRSLTAAAGTMVLVIIVAIVVFLVVKSLPALEANQASFLTEKGWFADSDPPSFGIAALAFGTIMTSFLALLAAVPVAVGIALFLSHYAPKALATSLGFAIDLLAAVPSVVFGLWGRDWFAGEVQAFSHWLHDTAGWIPLFGSDGPYGKSILLGSLVLAIMVLPIVTALCREVFRQTPTATEEAALALGATRWEMIRTAVFPHARPGMIAAVMLGLGRALGETIALALTLPAVFTVGWDILGPSGNSIAANIANRFGEAGDLGRSALIASGLVLFVITLVVNMIARAVVFRRREFSGSGI